MRACARAPSAMLTTSTPPSRSSFAAATAFDGSSPIGGFTSTETTKRPRAIFAASSLFCSSGAGLHRRPGSRAPSRSRRRSRARRRRPCARLDVSGRSRHARRGRDRSGCARASCRSSRRRAAPRRGSSAARRRRSTRASRRRPCARRPGAAARRWAQPRTGKPIGTILPTAASTPIGPSEQFTPTMLAPHSRASRAISSASVPSAMRPFSSSDALAMTGHAPLGRLDRGLDRGAKLGRLPDGLDDERVDAALEQRPRLLEEHCLHLREVLAAGVAARLAEEVPARPDGAEDVRLGPGGGPRATRTPAALSSRTRDDRPYFSSRSALAPNVLVSMTWAPARTKSSCTFATSSGRETLSSSKQAL